MKTFLAIVSFAVAPLLSANASSVGWGTASSNVLGDKDGNLAPMTFTVSLGYFSGLTDAQVTSNAAAGNGTTLQSSFQVFDSVPIGTGYGVPAAWNVNSTNGTAGFVGQRIYYFAYNTAAISTATQWGIFTAPSDLDWVFPANTPVVGSTSTDLSDVPTNATGILAGSFGPQTDGGGYFVGGAGATLYKMAAVSAVPEPSTFAGGAMLALAAMGMRRRRRG